MSEQRNEQPVQAFRAAGVVVMTIVVIFVLLGFGIWKIKDLAQLDDAVKLPSLVIAGLVSLIALLAVMAIAFKTVHLANQTQALGLPEGTVRAVIALSLILIFAVVTVYLFSALSQRSDEKCCEALAATDTTGTTTSTTTTGTATATTTEGPDKKNSPQPPASTPAEQQRATRASAAQDFAKQLLIMLGTLITSITSFYFGSKTGTDVLSRTNQNGQNPQNSTSKDTPNAPKLTGLNPGTVASGQPVTISGSNLNLIDAVVVRDDKGAEANATIGSKTDTAVIFTLEEALSGRWNVFGRTKDGVESVAPSPLTITRT